jgi:thioredoxin 1
LFKDGEARGLIKGTTSLDALIHLVDHPQDFAIEKGRSERETPPSVSVTLAAIPNVLESDFSESIKSAVVPILVYFYNDSDRTCMVTAPTVAEIAGIYKGKVNVLKIDTSINRLIPYRYGNAGSWGPTFLVFKHGKVKGRLDGAFSKEGAVRMIDKALAGK